MKTHFCIPLLLATFCVNSHAQQTLAFAEPNFERATPAGGNLRFTWIHGSISAKANTDVRIQVHRYNEHTFMLRQNPAVHWEAPFMYLLMGRNRAVLLDSGATEEAAYFPLRDVVDRTISRWSSVHGGIEPELWVLPLGADASQVGALNQFEDRPNTRVIQPSATQRASALGEEWPASTAQLDLGGRSLTLIPTPGLDAVALSVHDPWAGLLFTGNAFYPGRLVIRDFAAYKSSLETLVDFSNRNDINWIFGGRIEMSAQPGLDYILRSNYRPHERALQMRSSQLNKALQAVKLINGATDIRILDSFILMHGVGRGARDYGWPVFIPEQFDTARTR